MSNLKIEKINNINVNTGLLRNYGMITGGDFIAQCCEKAGRYRMFNTTSTYPPDAKTVSEGGSDYFVDTFLAENNTWVRLEARNVRNENVWERQCRGGKWLDWVLLPNNVQIQSKMDLKVDKVDGMSLTHNDFTDTYKIKVENMQNHFKGVFMNVADINAQTNCVKGDYCVLKGTPDFVYFYNGSAWVNSNASLGGDMLSSIYSPTGVFDLADRRNHHHEQAISTVTNLQSELDNKLNVSDKTKVIDNTNSTSVVDALSARVGNELKSNFLDIISGARPIAFSGVFEENGYVKLGNMILQWGTKDLGSSTAIVEITFPTPFTNRCLNVSVTPRASTYSGSGSNSCYAETIDNTKFRAVMDYKNVSVTTSCWWFAIGY